MTQERQRDAFEARRRCEAHEVGNRIFVEPIPLVGKSRRIAITSKGRQRARDHDRAPASVPPTRHSSRPTMHRYLMTLYAVATYAFFLLVFLFLIGFVGNFPLPRTIDGGASVPLGEAVAIDLALIVLFGIQHSVMARPAFKRWWTRIVPEPIERSTYVLAAASMLAVIFWQWRPIAEPIVWNVEQRAAAFALDALFWVGWGILLLATFLINHFELFGLHQVYSSLLGRRRLVQEFRTPLLYRHVRHPIYLGFLIAFWATPRMTAGHLLFAAGCTIYILVGIWFEERDLVAHLGDRYLRYREQVGMLLPWPRRRSSRNA
jgi:methanethiol S-methyltransferase